MTACGTDYLNKDFFSRSYILVYSCFVYFLPLIIIIWAYFYIVQAVCAHEKNMREQAKKMNVASLRSAENQATSAEAKLAKVRLSAKNARPDFLKRSFSCKPFAFYSFV